MGDAAEKLLEHLKKARFKSVKLSEGEDRSSLEVRLTDGTKGRVTLAAGTVVHLALDPKDPFRQELYGRAIEVPDEKADPQAVEEESGGGELSDDEVRFVDRVRRGPRGGRRR